MHSRTSALFHSNSISGTHRVCPLVTKCSQDLVVAAWSLKQLRPREKFVFAAPRELVHRLAGKRPVHRNIVQLAEL